MVTIKSCTDLSQSKVLATILPPESADMRIGNYVCESGKVDGTNIHYYSKGESFGAPEIISVWSLAALLNVASTHCSRLEITLRADKKYNVFAVKKDFVFRSFDECPEGYNNPVDACYEMIIKLHELNLL